VGNLAPCRDRSSGDFALNGQRYSAQPEISGLLYDELRFAGDNAGNAGDRASGTARSAQPDEIDEAYSKVTSTAGICDPDLLFSSVPVEKMRISNFLSSGIRLLAQKFI